MATLNPGVLVKLLDEMNSDEKPPGCGSGDHGRSPMLQIRSIVPVMEEGDLWPNRGFYLKVSDSSHAMYVSLPHEYDEMIFSNKLQLGQYIYVQQLEPATPVPILRGIKHVPGRHQQCAGNPEDLVFTKDLIGYCGGLSLSDSDSLSDKGVGVCVKKPMERPRSLSASRASQKALRNPRSIPMSPNKTTNSDVVKELSEISISCSERDSDSESSSLSFFGKPKAMRRSWNSTKEWSDSSPVVMHEKRPLSRSRSAGIYPCSYGGYDTDDSTISKSSVRRNTFQTSKGGRSTVNRRCSAPKDKHEIPKPEMPSASVSDRKWAKTTVSWGSLPPNLVKLGKEVIQQRDAALAAAVEALQEACAAERLIQCLSAYSEFQSTEDNNPQLNVVRLLDIHDKTVQARMIAQSLEMISSLRSDTNLSSPGSIKEALKLTSERKNCAVTWMKAALASDLSHFPDPVRIVTDSETNEPAKRLAPSIRFNKLKSACGVRKPKRSGEFQLGLSTVKENWGDWVKGASLHACIDLDNALQGDCRKCFLTCVEKFLDGIINKTVSTESDSQLAGVMCQIKRVDDWLDVIARKDNCSRKDGGDEDSMSEDEDDETCKRLKNKLYVVLLKHVERSAIALESMSATL